MTDSDCGDLTCGHGEYAACELAHGSGGGNGEMQCVCKHHKRQGRPTQSCIKLMMIRKARCETFLFLVYIHTDAIV